MTDSSSNNWKLDSTFLTFITVIIFWILIFVISSSELAKHGIPYSIYEIDLKSIIISLIYVSLYTIIAFPLSLIYIFFISGYSKSLFVVIGTVVFIIIPIISPDSGLINEAPDLPYILTISIIYNAIHANEIYKKVNLKKIRRVNFIIIAVILCLFLYLCLFSPILNAKATLLNENAFCYINGENYLFLGKSSAGIILTKVNFATQSNKIYCISQFGSFILVNSDNLQFINRNFDKHIIVH